MLSDDEKHELSGKLRAIPYQNLIDEMAKEVALDSCEFIRASLFHYSRAKKHNNAMDRIVCNDLPSLDDWFQEQGFDFIIDGLTTVIRKNGKVWQKRTYDVDARYAPDVVRRLEQFRAGGPSTSPQSPA